MLAVIVTGVSFVDNDTNGQLGTKRIAEMDELTKGVLHTRRVHSVQFEPIPYDDFDVELFEVGHAIGQVCQIS